MEWLQIFDLSWKSCWDFILKTSYPKTISVYDYHDTTDQGGLSENNHEISEIINASYATSNASPSPCWPNYQTSSENQNNFQANPNENNERYENHIEIINQDRYDLVCDDDESTFEEIQAENKDASQATSNDDTAG